MSKSSTRSTSTSPSQARFITVTVDETAQTVTVDPPDMVIPEGDMAVWQFNELPNGWTPALRFLDDSRQGLGPFTTLRTLEKQVWGEGSIGTAATHTYQAAALPPNSERSQNHILLSSPARISVAGEANSTPRLTVRPNVENGLFEVDMDTVTRFGDDSIVFVFEGLTENQVPSIQIHTVELQGSPTSEPSQHLGPFRAFCREENILTAEGSNGRYGRFEYIAVVAEMKDGEWCEKKLNRTPDPFIYSEEDPVDSN